MQPTKQLLGSLLLVILAATPATAEIRYTFERLGEIEGQWDDLNDLGQAIGTRETGDASTEPFLYTDGQSVGLGEVTGTPAWANAINNLGQVAGSRLVYDGGPLHQSFLYTAGQSKPLDGLDVAFGVNDLGHVVGRSTRAFLYAEGELTALGSLGGAVSEAKDINVGQIVGASEMLGSIAVRGFIYEHGAMRQLATLGGYRDSPTAINDIGQIVGGSDDPDDRSTHAVLWQDDQIISLGYLDEVALASARDINNSGVIIGYSGSRSFVWSSGVMEDLNNLIDPSLGYRVGAVAINNLGQILAVSRGTGNRSIGYILTPVPEPATAVLLAAGLVGLLRRRRGPWQEYPPRRH